MPLATVIHEGVVFSNRDKPILLDKLILLLTSLAITIPHYLVADRYYTISHNSCDDGAVQTVGEESQIQRSKVRSKCAILRLLTFRPSTFRPMAQLVLLSDYLSEVVLHFSQGDHPSAQVRPTPHHCCAIQCCCLYARAAHREAGTGPPRKYGCKMKIKDLFKDMSMFVSAQVWRRFGSWLRTIRPGIAPSEGVVSLALQQCLPEFVATNNKTNPLAKFIAQNLDLDWAEGWHLAS